MRDRPSYFAHCGRSTRNHKRLLPNSASLLGSTIPRNKGIVNLFEFKLLRLGNDLTEKHPSSRSRVRSIPDGEGTSRPRPTFEQDDSRFKARFRVHATRRRDPDGNLPARPRREGRAAPAGAGRDAKRLIALGDGEDGLGDEISTGYAPNCVEGEFSELRHNGVLRSSYVAWSSSSGPKSCARLYRTCMLCIHKTQLLDRG
jgi:hypothetical protein